MNNFKSVFNRLVEVGSGDGGVGDRGLESFDVEFGASVCFSHLFFHRQLAWLYPSPTYSASTGKHSVCWGYMYVDFLDRGRVGDLKNSRDPCLPQITASTRGSGVMMNNAKSRPFSVVPRSLTS